jgi:DegV family protein with EDD domain
MSGVAIVTDSNSGITQAQGKELGIYVLPMPFLIDDKEYFEDITLSQEEFYNKLAENAEVSTSQPTAGSVMELWDRVLADGYDSIVHIPMSSGLSGECETAIMLAEDYDGKVQVVNNQRISVTQRQSVFDAIELVSQGKTAVEIKEFLEKTKMDSSILIMVDTLKYLKKGGRVTPAGAALATILGIKPVLQINGGKLDAFSKARSVKIAKRTMIEGVMDDIQRRFPEDYKNNNYILQIAYSYDRATAEEFREEVLNAFPDVGDIIINSLSLSVSCHIGPGSLALAYTRKNI